VAIVAVAVVTVVTVVVVSVVTVIVVTVVVVVIVTVVVVCSIRKGQEMRERRGTERERTVVTATPVPVAVP
jgi:Ca2+/Na+ antiporter